MIQLLQRPVPLVHCRERWIDHGLKGPVLATFFPIDLATGPRRGELTRVWRSHRDPSRKVLNHRFRQLALRRHFERFIAQGLQKQALLDVARYQCRPTVTTLQQAATMIQTQPALHDLCALRMTLVTMGDQYRPNSCFKESLLLLAQRHSLRRRRRVRGVNPADAAQRPQEQANEPR